MYKTCLPCYLGMELTLIPFQQLIWPVLSTNYFWMKSQLSYSSTLEKVYWNPSDCVLVEKLQRLSFRGSWTRPCLVLRVRWWEWMTFWWQHQVESLLTWELSNRSRRLEKHNVKLNDAKCQLFQAQVKYMGHILSKHGISPVNSKLDAIRLAPRPKDVSQMRSFLGMLNYYSKFIKIFHPNCTHYISFSVTRLGDFGPKNLKRLLYGLKKFFPLSRFWFIMTFKNLSSWV